MENELNEILADAMKKPIEKNQNQNTPHSFAGGKGTENTFVDNAIDSVENSRENCPDWLPKKFWKDGVMNTKALATSYQHLEKKMSAVGGDNTVPDSDNDDDTAIEGEEISTDEIDGEGTESYVDDLESDGMKTVRDLMQNSDVEKNLRNQGFDDTQMQAVYDLAEEHFNPIVERMKKLNVKVMEQELEHHFGGADKWKNAQGNMTKWASANLPASTVEHLGSSVEGVKLLHQMMSSTMENGLGHTGNISNELSEDSLRSMMDDPRYWRTKDSAYIKKVQQGFKKLYPDD